MNNIEYTHVHKESGRNTRIICTNLIDSPHLGNEPKNYIVLQYDPIIGTEYIYFYSEKQFHDQHKKLNPWDNCKIDDPIYVKMYGSDTWHKRHFAGISEDGQPLFWSDGCTSFTADKSATSKAIECYSVDQAPEDVVQYAVACRKKTWRLHESNVPLSTNSVN
jgi:hypothetical protein